MNLWTAHYETSQVGIQFYLVNENTEAMVMQQVWQKGRVINVTNFICFGNVCQQMAVKMVTCGTHLCENGFYLIWLVLGIWLI